MNLCVKKCAARSSSAGGRRRSSRRSRSMLLLLLRSSSPPVLPPLTRSLLSFPSPCFPLSTLAFTPCSCLCVSAGGVGATRGTTTTTTADAGSAAAAATSLLSFFPSFLVVSPQHNSRSSHTTPHHTHSHPFDQRETSVGPASTPPPAPAVDPTTNHRPNTRCQTSETTETQTTRRSCRVRRH